ncbi:hypothetical protein GCM10008955_15930 [Deinococcus malanensis]|uniref:Uncharacterized protein n=1 Tax=Deinococcus malanensis TaxID=1706855 RepID=A0ABQ2ERQ0_9DEIO|nr:hypothetical protein GCM10008955_15930 [Deinococcus malanensis]
MFNRNDQATQTRRLQGPQTVLRPDCFLINLRRVVPDHSGGKLAGQAQNGVLVQGQNSRGQKPLSAPWPRLPAKAIFRASRSSKTSSHAGAGGALLTEESAYWSGKDAVTGTTVL